ncbi:MFS transporter [Chitinibacteraceae bacterium HSL-7]
MTLPKGVNHLALCQALYTLAISIQLTVTGLAGLQLASDKALATLPFALIIVTAALTTPLAARAVAANARRAFLGGGLLAIAGGLVALAAVVTHSFALLCAAALAAGGFQATSQYYRLAAADASEDKGRAIARVLTGGVLAALLGPLLMLAARKVWPDVTFAGPYLMVALMGVLTLGVVAIAPRLQVSQKGEVSGAQRSLRELLAQPRLQAALANNVVAYAVMVGVMTATPLAMHGCGFDVGASSQVIQWHLLGMFAPSLVAGWLSSRLGASGLSLTGIALMVVSAVVANLSLSLPAFYVALFLLGVGWNFMFVSGSTLLAQSYQPSERARVQGLSEALTSGSAALASLSAAPLLLALGWNGVNLNASWLLVLPLLATWRLRARPVAAA